MFLKKLLAQSGDQTDVIWKFYLSADTFWSPKTIGQVLGYATANVLLTTYKSFAWPLLNYGDIIYDQLNNESSNKSENIQYNTAFSYQLSNSKDIDKYSLQRIRFRVFEMQEMVHTPLHIISDQNI